MSSIDKLLGRIDENLDPKCVKCQREYDPDFLVDGLCAKCRPHEHECSECGQPWQCIPYGRRCRTHHRSPCPECVEELPWVKNIDHLFEKSLNNTLGMITESMQGYINMLRNSAEVDTARLMNYLEKSNEQEINDWVDALDIVVHEHGLDNRWVMGLAQRTSQLNMSNETLSKLREVLRTLNANSWPTVKTPKKNVDIKKLIGKEVSVKARNINIGLFADWKHGILDEVTDDGGIIYAWLNIDGMTYMLDPHDYEIKPYEEDQDDQVEMAYDVEKDAANLQDTIDNYDPYKQDDDDENEDEE